MKMLKNMNNVNALMTAVASCTDSVLLKSADGREEYNLKSALSLFIGIGHLKALECAETHDGVEAINLGTGNGISVLELVHAFENANDLQLAYVVGPRRDGDLPAFWADATKARDLLGWEATHSVEDMCRSSWNFAKNAST